jgi:hypothetical protein
VVDIALEHCAYTYFNLLTVILLIAFIAVMWCRNLAAI